LYNHPLAVCRGNAGDYVLIHHEKNSVYVVDRRGEVKNFKENAFPGITSNVPFFMPFTHRTYGGVVLIFVYEITSGNIYNISIDKLGGIKVSNTNTSGPAAYTATFATPKPYSIFTTDLTKLHAYTVYSQSSNRLYVFFSINSPVVSGYEVWYFCLARGSWHVIKCALPTTCNTAYLSLSDGINPMLVDRGKHAFRVRVLNPANGLWSDPKAWLLHEVAHIDNTEVLRGAHSINGGGTTLILTKRPSTNVRVTTTAKLNLTIPSADAFGQYMVMYRHEYTDTVCDVADIGGGEVLFLITDNISYAVINVLKPSIHDVSHPRAISSTTINLQTLFGGNYGIAKRNRYTKLNKALLSNMGYVGPGRKKVQLNTVFNNKALDVLTNQLNVPVTGRKNKISITETGSNNNAVAVTIHTREGIAGEYSFVINKGVWHSVFANKSNINEASKRYKILEVLKQAYLDETSK
jgi:hypothetical protein